MELAVKLEVFEGPLDLLLHLIDKNKIDIYDIPIAEITAQYMDYVDAMDKEDLDVVSEFLVMAATLLDIKARMLLPKEKNEEGEEEDPRTELVERLLEYRKYKYMSGELRDMSVGSDHIIYKEPSIPKEVAHYRPPVDLEALLQGVTMTRLRAVFEDVLKRQAQMMDPVRSQFGRIAEGDCADLRPDRLCAEEGALRWKALVPESAARGRDQDGDCRYIPGNSGADQDWRYSFYGRQYQR